MNFTCWGNRDDSKPCGFHSNQSVWLFSSLFLFSIIDPVKWFPNVYQTLKMCFHWLIIGHLKTQNQLLVKVSDHLSVQVFEEKMFEISLQIDFLPMHVCGSTTNNKGFLIWRSHYSLGRFLTQFHKREWWSIQYSISTAWGWRNLKRLMKSDGLVDTTPGGLGASNLNTKNGYELGVLDT